MIPGHYVDIELLAAPDGSTGSLPALRGLAFMQLHRLFRQRPGEFALALSARRIGVLRVFASARDDLDQLAAGMDAVNWFRDYTRLSYPRAAPEPYLGRRVAFVRYRIPTVKSDRHAVGGVSELRDRRLSHARENRLEHFKVRSGSNGAVFSLTVEQLASAELPWGGVPNSYGLSTRSNPVGLPLLE